MIENINSLENNSEINTDICIIGAGAAGITMALELNNSSKKVVLLEAGGFDFPTADEGLGLYSGESIGRDYDVQNSRLRFFGGSTNHWGGWCRPLDDIDFMSKKHIKHSGWPLTRDDLKEFYKKAAKICEIDHFEKFEQLNTSTNDNVLNLNSTSILTNKYFVFSPPTRFGKRYRSIIEQSTNISCFLYANATNLTISDDAVKGVEVHSIDGIKIQINTNKIIIAMGGLENARFLLLNSKINNPHGIPNKNNLIGKFFMDHPGIRPGAMLLENGLKYYRYKNKIMPLMPVLSLSNKTIIDEKLNNLAILLNPKKQDDTLPNSYLENSFFNKKNKGTAYDAQVIIEPTPYFKSQVTLSEKSDYFGQKKLNLNWQINPQDIDAIEKTFQIIGKELGLTDMGRIKIFDDYLGKFKQSSGYGMHHIGTTKMGTNRNTSVVDNFGESHEIKGLFLTGSSVFPTAGFSNPTLTIVALAIRLANKLKQSI